MLPHALGRELAMNFGPSWRRAQLAAVTVGYIATVAACTGVDSGQAGDAPSGGRSSAVVAPVDDQLPGFARVALLPASPPPPSSQTGAGSPAGILSYRLTPTRIPGGPPLSFEWYLRATNLLPDRAYRVDLTVDGTSLYSVGNGRADGSGTLTTHGILVRFADEYCVASPAAPQPIAGRHAITAALKSDGSGTGPATTQSGPLTDPGRSFPCRGNGDGLFEYWLVTQGPVTVGDGTTPAR